MYTKMTRIKQGKAGLNYILNEAAHNNHEQRNEYVTGVNLVDGVSWYKQFQYYWNRANDGHETQLRHLICSFSARELDPKNPDDIRRAHELFTEYVQAYYPHRQVVVATQIDGKSGLVHCHAMVNDCDMIDTRGCNEQQRYYKFFMKTCDDFMQEHGIKLDAGRNKDVVSQKTFEQIYEIKCKETAATKEVLLKQLEIAKDRGNAMEAEQIMKKIGEIKEPYIFKEHLKQRIQEAKEEANSYDDFMQKLDSKGVIAEDSGKHNKFRLKEEEYAKFTDKPYPAKATCRGKTLSPDFSREALKAYFESLAKKEEEKESFSKKELSEVQSEISEMVMEEFSAMVKNVIDEFVNAPEDEQTDDEGEYEDEALEVAGFADDKDMEEITDGEEETLNQMRKTIQKVFQKGNVFLDDDIEDEKDFEQW